MDEGLAAKADDEGQNPDPGDDAGHVYAPGGKDNARGHDHNRVMGEGANEGNDGLAAPSFRGNDPDDEIEDHRKNACHREGDESEQPRIPRPDDAIPEDVPAIFARPKDLVGEITPEDLPAEKEQDKEHETDDKEENAHHEENAVPEFSAFPFAHARFLFGNGIGNRFLVRSFWLIHAWLLS